MWRFFLVWRFFRALESSYFFHFFWEEQLDNTLYINVTTQVIIMTEYVDDELPLPPFADMFGEGIVSNKRKAKKLRDNPSGDETSG